MTYIPDARSKFKEQFFKNTRGASKEPERNPYWEGYLKDEDANFIRGFDMAVEQAVEYFFANLDNFADDLEEFDLDVDKIDTDILNGDKDYNEYDCEEEESMSKETRLFLLLRSELSDWLESNRDEWVTSIIDEYDLDEHEAHMDAVDSGKEKSQKFFSTDNVANGAKDDETSD